MVFYFLILLIIVILIYLMCVPYKKEKEPYTDTEIPLKIFQTWNTKLLPIYMKKNSQLLQKQNPQFEYYLFDDEDCLEFIHEYFDVSVENAFKKLIPGAYKADLWRYCVLYIHGGIYLDIKMKCVGDFRLIELTKQEHYVKDRDNVEYYMPGHYGIYNAMMIQKPKNPLMMDCIKKIVKNVDQQEYGFGFLYPTGPGLLGKLYEEKKDIYHLTEIDLFHEEYKEVISYKGRIIMEHYPEYRKEQLIHQNDLHYASLWDKNSIYLL